MVLMDVCPRQGTPRAEGEHCKRVARGPDSVAFGIRVPQRAQPARRFALGVVSRPFAPSSSRMTSGTMLVRGTGVSAGFQSCWDCRWSA